jgi:hypothetical protein
MKPRDADVERIKKILAEIERYRNDPQIAALIGIPTVPQSPVESAVEHAGPPIRGID